MGLAYITNGCRKRLWVSKMIPRYNTSHRVLLLCVINAWILIVLTIGCSPNPTGLWRNPPPNASTFFKDRIPRDQFNEIQAAMQNEAKKSLLNVGFVKLAADSAALYGYQASDFGGHFYLIRGVRCTDGGRFAIYRNGTEIYASHDDLGTSDKIHNTALVVWLKNPITSVYSSCSVAD
jgi:hypothetical protein